MVETFNDVVNSICELLPEGYEIDLSMENGSAWLSLETREGEYLKLPEFVDETIKDQLIAAVMVAIQHDKKHTRGTKCNLRLKVP